MNKRPTEIIDVALLAAKAMREMIENPSVRDLDRKEQVTNQLFELVFAALRAVAVELETQTDLLRIIKQRGDFL